MHIGLLIIQFVVFTWAAAIPDAYIARQAHHEVLTHKTIYEFPNETWVENLAVRQNGNLLVTLITASQVWEIDPLYQTAELVYHFPNALSALGIAETAPDVFAVIVGNWSVETFKATPHSWSVWQIDYRDSDSASSGPQVQKISDISSAGFLNGMTVLDTQANTVLLADSYRGVIYALDTETAAHGIIIDSPALKPNGSVPIELGVNGIRFHQDGTQPYLYFTNSFRTPLLGRFPLTRGGTAASAAEFVVKHATFPNNLGGQADDFTFDKQGNAWVTTDPSNTLIKVELPSAKVSIVAGGVNDSLIAGCTSAAFGRTKRDEGVLYVTTNGGLAYPPPSGIVGGKIVAFDTTSDGR